MRQRQMSWILGWKIIIKMRIRCINRGNICPVLNLLTMIFYKMKNWICCRQEWQIFII